MLRLFLHPVVSGQRIADLYRRAFAEAAELYVLSAYLRSWDTGLKITPDCGAFAFIIGKDFGITRKKACLDVLDWLPGERKPFFLIADSIFGFHPKALFWKTRDGSCYALIGSSNLTEGGLHSNYEANVFQKITATEFASVTRWIDAIREKSVPVTPRWLETYQEAPTSRGRKKRSDATPSFPATAVRLPSVEGAAGIVRERRQKKRLFATIRPRLMSAIRRCASENISNKRFFDVLQRTWSEGPRVQGWGWEVLGRDSDFRPLCQAILTIVDTKRSARDVQVIRCIDDLKAKQIPTRRALLSELLCLMFPDDYPILNEPVARYVKQFLKAPRGSTEGARYLYLASSLRAALRNHPKYPARDLLELDGLIWKYQDEHAA